MTRADYVKELTTLHQRAAELYQKLDVKEGSPKWKYAIQRQLFAAVSSLKTLLESLPI